MDYEMTGAISAWSELIKPNNDKLDAVKNDVVKFERRAMARYRDQLPITVKMDDSLLTAIAVEVSLAGMRIDCEGAIATHVFSQYIQVMPGENITAVLDFNIVDHAGLTIVLSSQAKLVSVNRAAQSRYIVGFKFLDFSENGLEDWKRYISSKCLL